ncbi:uncharacterized protein AruCF_0557 [Achromobacter ruhlandii]|nr:uncharacterized protein AruCF_0557 [Achromobacter ruhlandii]
MAVSRRVPGIRRWDGAAGTGSRVGTLAPDLQPGTILKRAESTKPADPGYFPMRAATPARPHW